MYSEEVLKFYEEFVKESKKLSKKSKKYYYYLNDIMKEVCQYYMTYGIRSNGKTTAVYILALIDYCITGRQLGLTRRWDLDFKGKKGREMFKGLANIKFKNMNLIEYLTNGKYNDITYYSSQWFLSRFDNELNKNVLDMIPFCHGFALNVGEHDKSVSYPKIGTILFDEFISRDGYIEEEFIKFMNTISTIVRERTDVTIFMCGNSINKYCPHFKEMGLYNIQKMQPDTIEYYKYGETNLKVGVEFTAITEDKKGKTKAKPSDIYFAFNNPKLQMITTGAWEIDIYPHLPCKYEEKDVKFRYFIIFEQDILQCEIIYKKKMLFTFIHRKTTKLKNENRDLIYRQDYSPFPNHSINITNPRNDIEKKIWWLFKTGKIFYQDNEIGEIVRNYLMWCKGEN